MGCLSDSGIDPGGAGALSERLPSENPSQDSKGYME